MAVQRTIKAAQACNHHCRNLEAARARRHWSVYHFVMPELEGVNQTSVLGHVSSLTSPVVAPQMIVMKLKKVNRPVYWFARFNCGDNMAPPAIAD